MADARTLEDMLTARGGGLDDLPAVMDALAQQPMLGVNVHARPEGLRPSWIQEQTIEPIPLGAMSDPVSQLAFLGAPGALRSLKGILETAASPGPRYGALLAGDRGNLGPVPRSATGEALPESAVRTPEGQLQRLYHGTPTKYADFSMEHMDPDGLYGPGIYMTNSPEIAGGSAEEVARGYAGYASKGYQADLPQQLKQWQDGLRYQLRDYYASMPQLQARASEPGIPAGARQIFERRLAQRQTQIADAEAQIAQLDKDIANAWQSGPHVRPVYADLKRPFDMTATMPKTQVRELLSGTPGAAHESVDNMLAGYRGQERLSGEDVYQLLTKRAFAGNKAAVNDYLQLYGYDGITHIGGAVTGGPSHRVYISFSPDTVYPAPNVEAGY